MRGFKGRWFNRAPIKFFLIVSILLLSRAWSQFNCNHLIRVLFFVVISPKRLHLKWNAFKGYLKMLSWFYILKRSCSFWNKKTTKSFQGRKRFYEYKINTILQCFFRFWNMNVWDLFMTGKVQSKKRSVTLEDLERS
jgi:hypothetical protein